MRTRIGDDQVAAATPTHHHSSNLKSSQFSPIVKLKRMAEIDKAAAASTSSSSSSTLSKSPIVSTCFLCGENAPTQLASLSQGRRHYMRQVELFQGYLNDDDNLHLLSSTEGLGGGNTKNMETCANCLKEIKEVWDLNQQIEAIREDIATIVERVVAAIPLRERISKTKPRQKGATRKANSEPCDDPEPDLDLNDMLMVEVKEEVEDHWSEFEDHNNVMDDDDDSCFEMLAINPDQQDKDDLAEMEITSPSPSKNASRPKRKSRIVAEEILQRTISSENCIKDELSENEMDTANSDTDESSISEEEGDNLQDSESEDEVTGQKKASCSHCIKVYATQKSLRLHIRRVHLHLLSHKCDQCDKAFICSSELTQHTKLTHSGQSFPCSACNKKLASRRRWAIHETLVCQVMAPERLKNEFNITLLPCPHPGCEKQFDRDSEVTRHLLTHTKSRPYSCSSCDKTFIHKTDLNHHISTICGPDADPAPRLKRASRHREQKKKVKPFPCPICRPARSFRTQHNLREHNSKFHPNIQVNQGDGVNVESSILKSVGANVLCDLCGVSMRPTQLKIHLRAVHEGHRNKACPQCGKCFFKASDRNRHVATVHAPPEEKEKGVKFLCGECGQEFRHRSGLYHHNARVHRGGGGENGKKHGCSKCPRRFYKRADRIRHENRHTSSGWWCFDCGKNFGSQKGLEEHQEGLDGIICKPNYRKKPKPKRPKVQEEEVEIDEAVRGIVDEEELQQV